MSVLSGRSYLKLFTYQYPFDQHLKLILELLILVTEFLCTLMISSQTDAERS